MTGSQKRIRDYGIIVGDLPTGTTNRITDVKGVKVGHCTIHNDTNHTGVTVILPGEDNPFLHKYTAAAYVHNGFGKTIGIPQIKELGTLETPIALTNTLNVGKVSDALISYMIETVHQEGKEVYSINPVVGECNDSLINSIQKRAVTEENVRKAIQIADVLFEEGSVGAGTSTICYGLKGGIGSASRVITIDNHNYTIGVLVQSNFGSTRDFILNGKPIGKDIEEQLKKPQSSYSQEDRGSIMTILATDLPVSDRQLYRIIRRCGVGIARTGAYTGHGSGEIMIGFTTANRHSDDHIQSFSCIHEDLINHAFKACAEAVHEAILNSMITTEPAHTTDGRIIHSLKEFI